VRAGHTASTVAINVPRQNNAPLTYSHPFRLEVADDTVRLIPLLPWPSGRDVAVTLSTQDMWGFPYNSTFTLHAAPGDSVRPEVVSIDPAPGSSIASGQTIVVKFSKPMLDATQLNGGLVFAQGVYGLSGGYWSADRQTLTLPFAPTYTSNGYLTAPASLVLSSALTDLAGNALRAITVVFPVNERLLPAPYSSALPAIVKSWPARNDSNARLDADSSIALLLSRPVDAPSLNRGLWVFTTEGRIAGNWSTSSGGLLATFTPNAPWAYGTTVRMIGYEPTVDLTYDWSISTPPAPSPNLTARRCTVPSFSDMPVNTAIEVEFDRDLPPGPSRLVLETGASIYSSFQSVPFDETAPSPRVRRLTPRTPLSVGSAVRVSLPANLPGLTGGQLGQARLVQPLTDPLPVLRGRSPLPGAEAVPRNARIALRVSAALNYLSVNDSTVKVSAGGRVLAVQLSAFGSPGALTATPLEPLPSNQTIDVTIQLAPISAAGRIENYEKHVITAKTQVQLPQPLQMAEKDGRGSHQQDGESHLRRHQTLAEKPPEPGIAGPSTVPQMRGRRQPEGIPCRSKTKQQSGEQRDSNGEEEHVQVGLHPHIDAFMCAAAGHDAHQDARPKVRQQDADERTRSRENHRLGQHLSHQVAATGADPNAHGHFPLPACRSREQHARHVDARQQQQQTHHGHQQRQRFAILIAHPREPCAGRLHFHLRLPDQRILAPAGPLRLSEPEQDRHFGLRPLQCDSWLQPPEHRDLVLLTRHPDTRPNPDPRPGIRTRRDTDDGLGHIADKDAPAEDRRITMKPAVPVGPAHYDHVSIAVRRHIFRPDQTPDRRL
jgi:hypothetical protein